MERSIYYGLQNVLIINMGKLYYKYFKKHLFLQVISQKKFCSQKGIMFKT